MKNRNAFTLVELLTTITILAVLAGIALGVTKLVFTKAHESKNQALIKTIEIALEQYKTKYGYYPNSAEKPNPFVMDAVDLANDTKNDPLNLKYNMWQFFDENFKNAHTKTGKVFVKFADGTGKQITATYVTDALGNPLIYRCPGVFNVGSFDLGSAGEDGCLGDKGVQINPNKKIETITASEYEKFGQGDDIVNFTNNLQ